MRKWEDSLRERLAASEDYGVEYLNAVLEEDDPQAFLLALRYVAEARGGKDKRVPSVSQRAFEKKVCIG